LRLVVEAVLVMVAMEAVVVVQVGLEQVQVFL
jgi:hypothetical protein